MEAVGQLARRCRAQPCVVGAINAWVCTICCTQIAVYSHICACALKRARHWRAGLTLAFKAAVYARRGQSTCTTSGNECRDAPSVTAQSAPRICGVCIRGFVALEHSVHARIHARGVTNELQMEAPPLTAPVLRIQHRGCEGHAVGYCDALRRTKRSG